MCGWISSAPISSAFWFCRRSYLLLALKHTPTIPSSSSSTTPPARSMAGQQVRFVEPSVVADLVRGPMQKEVRCNQVTTAAFQGAAPAPDSCLSVTDCRSPLWIAETT